MPTWAGYVLKVLLDWGWSKLAPFISKFVKSKKIDFEVDKEFSEFDKIRKEVEAWAKANPGKPLPKELEEKLRNAARKRTEGL